MIHINPATRLEQGTMAMERRSMRTPRPAPVSPTQQDIIMNGITINGPSILHLVLLATLGLAVAASALGAQEPLPKKHGIPELTLPGGQTDNPDKWNERMQWWRDAHFGMFITWGLYSIPAGEWKGKTLDGYAEWLMNKYRIPLAEYGTLAKAFNPVLFNADAWATLADEAGMGYFTLTTKFHDGFSMYDTAVSDYNVVRSTPFKRDVYGELVTAFRKRGMRVGAYYSQDLDWSVPSGQTSDVYNTWDFPIKERDNSIFDTYLKEKSFPQVKELCTKYNVDLFWFDVPRAMDAERGGRLRDLVRTYRPDAIINGRIATTNCGDYVIPGDNGYFSSEQPFAWECPCSISESYGYKKDVSTTRSADDLIKELVETVSSGGNLMLNVDPKPDGTFPERTMDVLRKFAFWMKDNKEAIRGARANPFGEFFTWGFCTVKERHIYLHVTDWKTDGTISVPRLKNRIVKVELLGDAERKLHWGKDEETLHVTMSGNPVHASVSVIKVTCEGPTLEVVPLQCAESNGEIPLETRYGKSRGYKMHILRHQVFEDHVVVNVSGNPKSSEHIVWDVKVDKPGVFQVVAKCLFRKEDVRRIQDRSLRIGVRPGGDVAGIVSVKDGSADGAYTCGTITIEQPGSVQVFVSPESGNWPVPVFLKELRLKRLP